MKAGIDRILEACGSRRGAAIAVLLLIALHLAFNALWLRLDDHVIRIDEEFHASAAQDYYYVMADPTLSGLEERMLELGTLESPYPPLLPVLGALCALVLGYSMDAIAFSGSVCFALVIWGAYRVARRVYSRQASLLAVLIVSLIPILYGGSRYVALENLIAVFSIWGLYFLMLSDGFRRWRYVALFALVNGLAILTKPNAFVYYLLPAAAVYGAGLWSAASVGGRRAVLGHLGRGLACLALTGAIALPWYLYHREMLSEYWMSEHKGGKTPFTFTKGEPPADDKPRQLLEDRINNPVQHSAKVNAPAPPITNTGEIPAIVAPTPPPAPPGPARHWSIDLRDMLTSREWAAYPILIINNALFLPLTLLGLAGLATGLVRHRASRGFWLLVLWLVGSYVLNTLLFRYINPRYTMPFIPVFGMFAAGFLTALRPARARSVLIACTLLLLLAQYANISFLGMDRLRASIPFLADHFRVKYFKDDGLAITKPEVITGTYCFRAPQYGENYVRRGFRAMIENEIRRGRAPGRVVNYISMSRQNNFGGFRNLESEYWPSPNPLLHDARPDHQYRFNRVLRCNTADEAQAAIAEADYIVAALDQTSATTGEGPRHIYFDEIRNLAPMEMTDFFFAPAYGLFPPAMFGVFSKDLSNPYSEVDDLRGREEGVSQEDLALNAIRLLALRARAGIPGGITHEQLADADARLAALIPRLEGVFQISPNIQLVKIFFDQPFSGWYRLRMLFKVLEQPQHDWRIFVSGSFSQEVAPRLPADIRAQKHFSWNFDPERPTSTWQPGEIVLCTREFHCPPVPLENISIGFFRNGTEGWGQILNTGPIDFSDFPVNDTAVIRD